MDDSSRPEFFLGIDGGGTKTEAVITDSLGRVIGRGKAGGSNLHNLPLDIVHSHLIAAIDAACVEASDFQIDKFDFTAACLGLAGLDSPADKDKFLKYLDNLPGGQNRYKAAKMQVCSDGFIGLKSGTDEERGVCIIASTGCNCFGFYNGAEVTAGDWGYLLGDQGSAYTLGLELIRLAVKEHDGRRPPTLLKDLLLQSLNLHQISDLINWAYGGPVPVKEIAALSRLYNHPDLINMSELSRALDQSVSEIMSAYQAVVRRLSLTDTDSLPVVLVGGLFNLESFSQKIIQAVTGFAPQVKIIRPTISPAEGAAKIALNL